MSSPMGLAAQIITRVQAVAIYTRLDKPDVCEVNGCEDDPPPCLEEPK